MEVSSLSPGHIEAATLLTERYMAEVHTCLPGVVVSFNAATQSATVQPSLMRRYKTDPPSAAVALPQINNVPVVYPGSRSSWMRFPLYPGDPVMLHFSERSLDAWFNGAGTAPLDPVIPHKFSLTDAIAVPGLRTAAQAIVPKGAATSLEIVNGPTRIEITAEGQVAISNGTNEVIQALITFLTGLNTTTLSAQAASAVTALTPFLAP